MKNNCLQKAGFQNTWRDGIEAAIQLLQDCEKNSPEWLIDRLRDYQGVYDQAIEQAQSVREPKTLIDPAEYDDFEAAVSHNRCISSKREVGLTRDTNGVCIVTVNGREAIRDSGDVISHFATLDWFHAAPPPRQPLTDEQRKGITAMWSKRHRNYTVGDIIDAVEAAHGIKENT